jgi:tetratricopeptide (TPR) repeat protein
MTHKDAPTPAGAETITPLSVPKKMRRDDENLKRRYRIGIIALLGAIVGLVAGGAWLLNHLSNSPLPSPPATTSYPAGKPEVQDKSAVPTKTLPPPAVDPAQLALDKVKADQKLAEFLEIKEVLDRKAASAWGAAAYAEMSELAREADTHLMHEEFLPAADKYEQATALGGRLNDRTADALHRLLAEGQDALNQGQGTVAQNKFNVALMIDPTDLSAQRGLKRAKTIEAVVRLINSGRQHEADQALSAAQADYRQALNIDPDAAEAHQALNRVTALVNEQQFKQRMSEGLTALYKNDYELAHSRLLEARSLKPDSREVADALFQVDQARRLARIDHLRKEARIADQSEQWQSALDSYQTALAIDKSLQFAVRGKKRAEAQIRLGKRLNFFISQPQALESDKQLNNAVLLLNEAQAVEPQGPKLAVQIKKLEELVAVARTPVDVIIESDNLTQIAVYKVGKLGRFSQHELKLRPGTYTVVGARDGYQDVRQQIVVKADQPLLRVTIKCRDKI